MVAVRSVAVGWAMLAAACATEPPGVAAQALVGGQQSAPGAFPATGMIVAGSSLRCTATLIAPDVALTAGHCLDAPAFGSLGFTLDRDAVDGTEGVVPIRFTHPHPDFDASHGFTGLGARNDIAVVILERPIFDVEPARIEDPTRTPVALDPGESLAACGYGTVVWHTGTTPRKRDAEVVVDRVERVEFATAATGPQPCNGDSGGPLYRTDERGPYVVGVVSRAVGESLMCDTGAIATRVGPYAAWIEAASNDRDAGCAASGRAPSPLVAAVLAWVWRRRRRRA